VCCHDLKTIRRCRKIKGRHHCHDAEDRSRRLAHVTGKAGRLPFDTLPIEFSVDAHGLYLS
jgi:hypothetical protein